MEYPSGYLLRSGISLPRVGLISLLALSFFPGISSSRIVSLGSLEIYSTHDWLPTEPTVYFKCQGENKTILPDVKKTYSLYIFRGEESWQPLTELPDKKCKRCGFYEEDPITKDDVFDEWEFCSSDFVEGKYVRFKEKEFNATFICPGCTDSAGSNPTTSPIDPVVKSPNMLIIIIICLLASIIAGGGGYAIYRYWQKRKRAQDQARFLKLFEEGDDIEDELGLGHI